MRFNGPIIECSAPLAVSNVKAATNLEKKHTKKLCNSSAAQEDMHRMIEPTIKSCILCPLILPYTTSYAICKKRIKLKPFIAETRIMHVKNPELATRKLLHTDMHMSISYGASEWHENRPITTLRLTPLRTPTSPFHPRL